MVYSLVREQVPHATEISAGMSGDLEAAVRWGSTCVRVGSDIMGKRPALYTTLAVSLFS